MLAHRTTSVPDCHQRRLAPNGDTHRWRSVAKNRSRWHPPERTVKLSPILPGGESLPVPWENRMLCPFCKENETRVIDSRASEEFVIRRRRECLNLKCGRRFTTYEKIEEVPLNVIKKDGSRVPFSRDKIRTGLEKACYKRPVSAEQIERIVSQVEAEIHRDFEREVGSRAIGELVFNLLREVDQVAFVRFASVYREFQDVNDFVEELEPILRRSGRS